MVRSSRAYKASEMVSEAYRLCLAEVRPVCGKKALTFPVVQSWSLLGLSLSLESDSNHVFRNVAPKHECISAELESKFLFESDFSVGV